MKRADAQRAAILVEALAAIEDERTADDLASDDVGETWDYRGMRLGIAAMSLGPGGDFGGANVDCWIDIDIATARLLIPLLRRLIEGELAKLGVEP